MTTYEHSTSLTPAQASDVIKYYQRCFNDGTMPDKSLRPNQSNRVISLSVSAIRSTLKRYSITPDGLPALTLNEMNSGLDYIKSGWPIEPTDEQWAKIYHVQDTRELPMDESYFTVMGVKPYNWQ